MRTYSRVFWVTGAIAFMALPGGCVAPMSTDGPRPTTIATPATAAAEDPIPAGEEPQFTPPPAEPMETPPLLKISGAVADSQGHTLNITTSIIEVAPPTSKDLQAFQAAACNPVDSTLFSRPDTRLVTIEVSTTSPSNFAGWSDDRGIMVSGDLFEGSIWSKPPSGPGACVAPSKISGPGAGIVKVLTTSADWSVEAPVAEASAATLYHYGFSAITHTALGHPTGAYLASCTTEVSAEFERWAALASDWIPWQEAIWSDQCGHGRLATDY